MMKVDIKMPVVFICTFVWIGFVCAISFMEAWLKFQAPGITLPLGLGIGRLVFGVLNKVEWVFALVIVTFPLLVKPVIGKLNFLCGLIAAAIVLLQTIWLLPALDARAQLIIDGVLLPMSNLHFYYIMLEVVKVICLFIFGISQFKQSNS